MLARALATHYLPTRLTATHLHVAVRSAAAAAAKTPPHTYTPALQPFSPPSTTSAFPLTLLEANLSPQRPPFQAPVLRTLHSSPYSPAAHPFISHPENQPRRAMSSTGGGAAAAGGGGGSSRSTLTLRNFTKLCDKVRANTAVQLYIPPADTLPPPNPYAMRVCRQIPRNSVVWADSSTHVRQRCVCDKALQHLIPSIPSFSLKWIRFTVHHARLPLGCDAGRLNRKEKGDCKVLRCGERQVASSSRPGAALQNVSC